MLKTLPKIPWKCPESICTLCFTYESLHVAEQQKKRFGVKTSEVEK
jgi:hypothetical protein